MWWGWIKWGILHNITNEYQKENGLSKDQKKEEKESQLFENFDSRLNFDRVSALPGV